MSEEQLKAFIAKVKADASLQEQLKAEGADVVAIAKAAGFSINTQDLEADSENLSDEELEGVAGGADGFDRSLYTQSPCKDGFFYCFNHPKKPIYSLQNLAQLSTVIIS